MIKTIAVLIVLTFIFVVFSKETRSELIDGVINFQSTEPLNVWLEEEDPPGWQDIYVFALSREQTIRFKCRHEEDEVSSHFDQETNEFVVECNRPCRNKCGR